MPETTIHIDDLRKVHALRDLPDEHLQWILERGKYQEYEDGCIILKPGQSADEMLFILDGSASFYMDVHGRQVYYFTFSNNENTGGVTGLLPYSRMKSSPGYSYAIGLVKVLALHKKYFPELEILNPVLIQRLIAHMTDRAKAFATVQLQQEKVNALGKLSAGIAHELNNPASAITRISSELTKRLIDNFDNTEKLLFHCITAESIRSMRQMLEERTKPDYRNNKLSALKRMEQEDNLREWFEKKNIFNTDDVCETFTEAGITMEELDKILALSGEQAFGDVVKWLENLLSSQRIINDLADASGRISKLVGAIKSHVHMDRTNDVQATNIGQDIENTLTLLGHKLRDKNIKVDKKYPEHIPDVDAFVGELNQVWMNIIDNAIFAMEKDGVLGIEIIPRSSDIKISITDNGSGIPADILPRIFDPFFTTKKMGSGTGIGLEIVDRIIKRHHGKIEVTSVPGKTEFLVCLPLQYNKELINFETK